MTERRRAASVKSTCRTCNRTILVVDIDGRRAEVDPEIINTVPIDGAPAFVMSRRAHADMCESYMIAARKLKIRAEQREYENKKPRIVGIVPRKREPGQ
jgi:hypothetical protein